MAKNNNCKGCNKELEWYRGRPKDWCAKCLYLNSLKRGREYYHKNRKAKLDYQKRRRLNKINTGS